MKTLSEINVDYNEFNIDSLDKLSYSINKIESIVRNSKIYKRYLSTVYENFVTVISPDYEDINLLETNDMETEFHHIIPLYDLVQIVGTKLISEQRSYLSYLDIANEVLMIHMQDLIPGVVLSVSYHQAIHEGKRNLSPNLSGLHIGDYRNFIKLYKDFLTDSDYKKYYSIGISQSEIESIINENSKD